MKNNISVIAVALMLAGCGGGSGKESTPAPAPAPAPVNNTPVANGTNLELNANMSIEVDLSGLSSDTNADTLTYSITSEPQNGTVSIAGATLTYTPNASFVGDDSVTFNVTDGQVSASATIAFNILNTNPLAVNDEFTTLSNQAIILSVLANDSDNESQTLIIDSFSDVTNGIVSQDQNNNYIFTPIANFVGTATASYTITDEHGGQASSAIIINVDNRSPIATNDEFTTLSNQAITLNVLSNDSDNESQTLTIDSLADVTNGKVSQDQNNNYVFTPTANFVGTATASYTIIDEHGGQASAAIVINVDNRSPIAVGDELWTTIDTPLSELPAISNDSDPESGVLIYSSVGTSVNAIITLDSDNTISYTPNAGYFGLDSFDYTIEDEHGATATATITMHVAVDEFDLNTIKTANQGNGTLITNQGLSSSPQFGGYLSFGDFNGDTIADISVSSLDAVIDGDSQTGEAYVLFGSNALPAAIDVQNLTTETGFSIQGHQAMTGLGSYAQLMDFDGDSYSDLIIGAPYLDSGLNVNTGAIYAIYGQANVTNTQTKTSQLAGNGFTSTQYMGSDTLLNTLGSYLNNVGDINGDGYQDFIANEGYSSENNNAYIALGSANAKSTENVDLTEGIKITNTDNNAELFPHSIGDINNDGYDDFALSIEDLLRYDAGSYIYYGKANFNSSLTLADADITLPPSSLTGELGRSTSALGDINGDGIDDFILSEHAHDDGTYFGKAYVVYGSQTLPANINVSNYFDDSIKGFSIHSSSVLNNRFGFTVSSAGDFNGDGNPDLIVESGYSAKFALIYGGQEFETSYDVDQLLSVNDATGLKGVVFNGLSHTRGYAVSPKGQPLNGLAAGMDFNGDGQDDLAISDTVSKEVFVLYGGQRWIGNQQ